MGDSNISTPFEEGDHLLVVWAFPPPEDALNKIKSGVPSLKITFHLVQWNAKEAPNTRTAAPEGVPDSLWLSATHLCTMANLPPPHLVPKLTRLRMVQFTSAGINHVVKHPLYTDTDVPLCTVSGIHGPPISEWVVMSILAEGHRLRLVERLQRERKWGDLIGKEQGSMRDCVGKRCGILGYGSIGRQTARVLTALGMTTLAYTASSRANPESRKDTGYIVPGTQGDRDGTLPAEWFSGTSKSDLHNFLNQDLDYLVIAVPLTSGTTKLIGTEELDILAKSNCFLLNISRGQILDQSALIESLKAGLAAQKADPVKALTKGINEGIRGAALDVTDPEPLSADSELWELENCWVSPHVSAVNPEYWPRALGVLQENLGREERGQELVNLVCRKKGY